MNNIPSRRRHQFSAMPFGVVQAATAACTRSARFSTCIHVTVWGADQTVNLPADMAASPVTTRRHAMATDWATRGHQATPPLLTPKGLIMSAMPIKTLAATPAGKGQA